MLMRGLRIKKLVNSIFLSMSIVKKKRHFNKGIKQPDVQLHLEEGRHLPSIKKWSQLQ